MVPHSSTEMRGPERKKASHLLNLRFPEYSIVGFTRVEEDS